MPLPTPASLGLPAKPGSAEAIAANNAAAEASVSRAADCGICAAPAKYTCPRCAARTCSLPCSRAHKDKSGCSGERNAASFVPLSKYSQGTWDGDYAWLEEGRRKVAGWGEGLTADELTAVGGESGRGGHAAARGRGRGGARNTTTTRRSKLDGLRWAMSEIGCEVDLLPDGMQRRRANQSSWNPKTRALYLTIHLSVPEALLEGIEKPVLTHPRVHVLPPTTLPATPRSLLPEPLRERQDLVLAVPYHAPRRRGDLAAAALPAGHRFFPPLGPDEPLGHALSGTAFVEFPIVHVFERSTWERALGTSEVAVIPLLETKRKAAPAAEAEGVEEEAEAEAEAAPAAKRARPLSPAEAPKASGLGLGLGAYESEAEEDEEEGEQAATEAEAAGEEVGDIALPPEMAAALGAALEADFGQ